MKTSKPNILLIVTDEHAAHVAGYAGDRTIRIPNLERLASRSLRFEQAYCASPGCTPSRMCMLTGKEPYHCAAWGNHWIIYPEHATWPGHFAAHGYATALVGKMHFGGRDQMQGFQARPYGDLKHGLGHQPEPLILYPGYDAQQSAGVTEIPESLNHDVVATRESLAWVGEQRDAHPDQPWFLCTSYTRPHSPFTAPRRIFRRYEGRVFAEKLAEDRLADADPYTRLLSPKVGQDITTQEENDRGLQGYYAALDFVDGCIGELLGGLEKSGALKNTIIIYTSDHGEMGGRHGHFGKGIHWEESIRVPLYIHLPGAAEKRAVVERPISLIDLFPTTCGLAGLPVPRGLDGIDLSRAVRAGGKGRWRRETVSSMFCLYGARVVSHGVGSVGPRTPASAFRTVRWKDWKYVAIQGAKPLLFDLKRDSLERKNLAGLDKHRALIRKLNAIAFADGSWRDYRRWLVRDRARIPAHASGKRSSTPNQYMLPDGRTFDAEESLYNARWLPIVPKLTGGIIPQQFF